MRPGEGPACGDFRQHRICIFLCDTCLRPFTEHVRRVDLAPPADPPPRVVDVAGRSEEPTHQP